MNVDLSGKAVVVTGAASGIGRAVAMHAAQSGAAALILTDRDEAGCREAAAAAADTGCEAESVVADLLDVAAPRAIAAAARERFGRIDALVNAAGLTTRASFIDAEPDTWETLFAVNARAPFFLMQETIADLSARNAPGAIVNVLSMNAHCGAPDLAVYSASKGALATLTKNAANAHMAERIRVNGINLGWTLTEAELRMQADTLGHGPGWLAEAAAAAPLGRLVMPEEAARLAIFLLSDASIPMSGAVIDLDQKVAGAIR